MIALSEIHRSPTHASALLAMFCASLVGGSFFVQHVLLVEPCPLCIIQRFTYVALALTFLGAALLGRKPQLQRAALALALLLVLTGGGVAAYQSQLQLFPPAQAATCGPGLSYMLETLPVGEAVGQLFQAHGDCSDTSFRILGLTLAQISFGIFTALLVWLVPALLRKPAPLAR
jgi:protein dithiol:quinone oxidoreductase